MKKKIITFFRQISFLVHCTYVKYFCDDISYSSNVKSSVPLEDMYPFGPGAFDRTIAESYRDPNEGDIVKEYLYNLFPFFGYSPTYVWVRK